MNSLIDKNGHKIDCSGQTHVQVCKAKFHCPLSAFLQSGGVRVKIYYDHIAIEAGRPISDKQQRVINRILRDNEVYVAVWQIKGIYGERITHRPMRSFAI